MSNPLKKTMVFLGLAEEEFDDITDAEAPERATRASETVETQAPVTPLRRVTPVTKAATGSMNEILTMHPTKYSDVQTVAENFREGVPVILNLSRMNEADAKRLIDFSSGLSMGLNGKIERVTSKVFLLSPEHIHVSVENQELSGEAASGSFFVTPK